MVCTNRPHIPITKLCVLQECTMTSCFFPTYAYAFRGGSWEKWEFWEKTWEEMHTEWLIRNSVAFMKTAGKNAHLLCNDVFPPFRCNPDGTFDTWVGKFTGRMEAVFRAPVHLCHVKSILCFYSPYDVLPSLVHCIPFPSCLCYSIDFVHYSHPNRSCMVLSGCRVRAL